MKSLIDQMIDMIFRGVVGLVIIYVLELICARQGFPVLAGINPATFFMVAALGIPGFLLVFAMGLIYLF